MSIPKRNAATVTMSCDNDDSTLLSHALFAVNRRTVRKKKHVGSLFSNMRPTLIPAKGKASSYWLTPREHLYPDWRKLVGSVYPVVSQLVSSHSFPLPRLKMMERRFNARKAFCGSQVRNISCTMADIWKASKYRRLDLYDTAKVIW